VHQKASISELCYTLSYVIVDILQNFNINCYMIYVRRENIIRISCYSDLRNSRPILNVQYRYVNETHKGYKILVRFKKQKAVLIVRIA